MYNILVAPKSSKPLGSRPDMYPMDKGLNMDELKLECLNRLRSSRRAWASVESEDGTCVYLLTESAAKERHGSNMKNLDMPIFKSRKVKNGQ